MTNKLIKLLQAEHPNGVNLYYVDYSDFLPLETLQNMIHGDDSALDNVFDNWSVSEVVDDIVSGLEGWSSATDEEMEEAIDWIYNNDKSTPIKDLIHNSRKQKAFMFYDLNIEASNWDYSTQGKRNAEARIICKKLNINYTPEIAGIFKDLQANAYDGGQYCLLWHDSPANYITDDFQALTGNTLSMEEPEICIMDRVNGSGDSQIIKNVTIKTAFNVKNLWIDEVAGGYSYSGDVCGLYGPSFDNTAIITHEKKQRKATANAKIEKAKKQLAEWDEKLKATGECSFFDHRFKSHDTEYRNVGGQIKK